MNLEKRGRQEEEVIHEPEYVHRALQFVNLFKDIVHFFFFIIILADIQKRT